MRRHPTRLSDIVARWIEKATEDDDAKKHLETFVGENHHARLGASRVTFEVFKAFERIGPPITTHAEATAFRKGRLTLTVRQSSWLTELALMERVLLTRINDILRRPRVKEVRLLLGNPKTKRQQKSKRPPKLGHEQNELIKDWCSNLSNDDVRQAFAAAAARSLSEGPAKANPYKGPAGPRVAPPTANEIIEEEEQILSYGWGDRMVDRWTFNPEE